MEYNNRAKTVLRDIARIALIGGGGVWFVSWLVIASAYETGLRDSAAVWQLIGGGVFALGVLFWIAWLVAASTEYAIEYYFERLDKREKNRLEQ